MNQGTKHDQLKPRLDLLPSRPVEEVALVLAFGGGKYGDNNWRKGMFWSRVIAASLRHIFAFMRGEDKDPESGLSHLAHAATNLLFLIEYTHTKKDHDDRYNPKT